MNGKIYDENFLKNETAAENTVDWFELPCEKFDIYGLIPGVDGIFTCRIPREIAKTVSTTVLSECGYGAGGRVLFSTNSSFVAIKVEYAYGAVPTVCNHCFTHGFDLYKFGDDETYKFVAAYRPAKDFDYKTAEYKANTKNNGEMGSFLINTPHFSGVKKLYIGLEKGSKLEHGASYRNEKPIIFYGSSITHGAAAGRPGNTYENFISQKYNLNYTNLGFAGGAKGQVEIAEYMAGLDMCMFVSDYDHNAPDAEHLKETHFRLYEIIRKKHPDIPYIMISKPDFSSNSKADVARRGVIIESFEKARAAGDENVYFIDGGTLFDGEFRESCTSDGCHPNDLGFYRMADKIGAVIARAMNIE